jgi:hypothetical protein
MSEEILVGCPYCHRLAWSDRRKLERDQVIACESCRSLVSVSTAEAVGRELEARERRRCVSAADLAFVGK